MRAPFAIALAVLIGAPLCASAKVENMGTWGSVWDIGESDALDDVHAKIKKMQQSGEIDKIKREWQTKALTRIEEGPEPVQGIQRAMRNSVRLFDPSMELGENVTDHQGNVVAMAGTKVNPLRAARLRRDYIFLDGTDAQQVRWAINLARAVTPPTLILTRGSPVRLMRENPGVRFYFDQFGRISSRLQITAVPSIVRQMGDKIEITERAAL